MNPIIMILGVITPALLSYLLARVGRDADGAGRVAYELGHATCAIALFIIVEQFLMVQGGLTGIGLVSTAALLASLLLIVTHVVIRLIREDE